MSCWTFYTPMISCKNRLVSPSKNCRIPWKMSSEPFGRRTPMWWAAFTPEPPPSKRISPGFTPFLIIFSRTGKRTIKGAIKDGKNSVVRYIYNNFYDGHRQNCFDALLGKIDPLRFTYAQNKLNPFLTLLVIVFLFSILNLWLVAIYNFKFILKPLVLQQFYSFSQSFVETQQ